MTLCMSMTRNNLELMNSEMKIDMLHAECE